MEDLRQTDFNGIPSILSEKHPIPFSLTERAEGDWQAYFCCQYTKNTAHASEVHIQDYHEILVIAQSARRYLSENTVFGVQRGDILLFSAGERHMSIAPPGDDEYLRYYFYFNPAVFAHLPDGELFSSLFRRTASDGPNRITPEPAVRNRLLSGLSAFRSLTARDCTPLDLLRLRALMYELLTELCVCRAEHPAAGKIQQPFLSEVLAYMNANAAHIPTAAAISAHFGVSESYLSRVFRNTLAMSPYQYLMNIRLLEAKRLLEAGVSVTDACFSAGFSDCSHFIRYFRRAYGMTPAVWQKHGHDGSRGIGNS